jgi:hypothetical protein
MERSLELRLELFSTLLLKFFFIFVKMKFKIL